MPRAGLLVAKGIELAFDNLAGCFLYDNASGHLVFDCDDDQGSKWSLAPLFPPYLVALSTQQIAFMRWDQARRPEEQKPDNIELTEKQRNDKAPPSEEVLEWLIGEKGAKIMVKDCRYRRLMLRGDADLPPATATSSSSVSSSSSLSSSPSSSTSVSPASASGPCSLSTSTVLHQGPHCTPLSLLLLWCAVLTFACWAASLCCSASLLSAATATADAADDEHVDSKRGGPSKAAAEAEHEPVRPHRPHSPPTHSSLPIHPPTARPHLRLQCSAHPILSSRIRLLMPSALLSSVLPWPVGLRV